MKVEYKDDKRLDPVTNADRESQEYLKGAIAAHFPDHGILSEEDEEGPDQPAADFVWALDPLDGTKNFLGGLPVYACSVGVMHRGRPVAGAIFVPWPCDEGGLVLHARKGGGAFLDGEPISVLQAEEPDPRALATVPWALGAPYRFRKLMLGKVGELRGTGSTAYELAMTAKGVLQYSVQARPSLWDVVAGATLIAEAGGQAMVGRRAGGLASLLSPTRWEPVGPMVPEWRSGDTTIKELRRWAKPMVFGSPGVVRYVTANMRTGPPLVRRLTRLAHRRVWPTGQR